MKTNQTLIAGILAALALTASAASAQAATLSFNTFRGSMRLVQDVPCNGKVEATTTIADGIMDIVPVASGREQTVGGFQQFDLTRLELFMTPFAVQVECLGVKATVDFREVGATLQSSVRFVGQPIGSLEDRHYSFTIPKSKVLIFESITDNAPVKQPETAYEGPIEDITGEFNLRTRTVTLHIALGANLHFQFGCVAGKCLINEILGGKQTVDAGGQLAIPGIDTDHDGVRDAIDNCPLVPNPRQEKITSPTLTVPQDAWFTACQAPNIGQASARDVCNARPVAVSNNAPASFPVGQTIVTWMAADGIDPMVSGKQTVTVMPDRAPAVSCMAITPQRFRVAASDDCSQPTLKLGSFALANGEVVQIEQTGKPGVRLIGTVGPENKIRHFQVGKGEDVILSMDSAGNVGRVSCSVPVATDTVKK